jgi:glutaredoxin-like YruB-family protein
MTNKNNIVVYTAPNCIYCHNLKIFLRENNISFKEIDVSLDPYGAQEMIQKSGQLGVPVIDIDGKIVVGFDRDKIKELLNI